MKNLKIIILVALAILAAACNDNEDIADIENVKPVEIVNGQENGVDYADLGLPSGTLWATCNVGATSPEHPGLYFAWGETVGYTAEYVESGERAFDYENYTDPSVSGNLKLEQDAARVNLGGNWRMPTYDEWKELIENCNVSWEKNYNGTGVAGRVFTSRVNGNSVFFPAAGCCFLSSAHDVGSYGYYWSASWGGSRVLSLYFGSGFQSRYNSIRYCGYSVRGVWRKC